ncbi:MAG: ABC transporter substrate-binding protein [Janthinobacterium lividum]
MKIDLTRRRTLAMGGALALLGLPGVSAWADKKNGPGITDTEIVFGQTMPYSGPVSVLAAVGRVQLAYFKMINDHGGVNGRKLRLISLDDGYSPPKTVEQTRRLVEQEDVAFIFSTLGTPTNAAIQKYLNAKKVPQLFISGSSPKFYDPKNSPWTLSGVTSIGIESVIHAHYLLKTKPDAKVGILYANDDYGKGYLQGFKEGLGERAASMIIHEASYESTDPTVDSQVVTLQSSGADVFMNYSTSKFATQAIRKAYDVGWRPLQFIPVSAASIGTVIKPAGVEKAVGIISAVDKKDVSDPSVQQDADVKAYLAWQKQYYPEGHPDDGSEVFAYEMAVMLVQLLQRCGNDLTRENIMRQATNWPKIDLPMSLPGIVASVSPDDYHVVRQMQLKRFDGKQWVRFGDLIRG